MCRFGDLFFRRQRRRVVTEAQVDRAIAGGRLLLKREAVWVLEKAISIHDYYVRLQTDDPAITGDDEVHEQWNAWYYGTINLITDGYDALLTFDDAIDKLTYDAEIHEWYMSHPEYIQEHPDVGDYWHHKKWADRWKAIVRLLEVKRGEIGG